MNTRFTRGALSWCDHFHSNIRHGTLPSTEEGIMPAEHEHSAVTDEHAGFLSKRAVLQLVPISDVTLWTWCRTGYFPAPRVIGSKTVWLARDVFRWMETRPLRQYKEGA
jgi:predicted DNA-binding transcriptional regulator AlpA